MIFTSRNLFTGLYKHTNPMRNQMFGLSQNFRFSEFRSNLNTQDNECIRNIENEHDFNEFQYEVKQQNNNQYKPRQYSSLIFQQSYRNIALQTKPNYFFSQTKTQQKHQHQPKQQQKDKLKTSHDSKISMNKSETINKTQAKNPQGKTKSDPKQPQPIVKNQPKLVKQQNKPKDQKQKIKLTQPLVNQQPDLIFNTKTSSKSKQSSSHINLKQTDLKALLQSIQRIQKMTELQNLILKQMQKDARIHNRIYMILMFFFVAGIGTVGFFLGQVKLTHQLKLF